MSSDFEPDRRNQADRFERDMRRRQRPAPRRRRHEPRAQPDDLGNTRVRCAVCGLAWDRWSDFPCERSE
jgi:hypothetical protein